jgi:hypothetical protein
MAALVAGDTAGGQRIGRESAALLAESRKTNPVLNFFISVRKTRVPKINCGNHSAQYIPIPGFPLAEVAVRDSR